MQYYYGILCVEMNKKNYGDFYHLCRKELLSVDDIENVYGKKQRSNKEERIASAKV